MSALKVMHYVLRSVERVVVRIETAMTLVLMSGIALFVAAGIVARLLSLTIPWTNEMAQILLIWLMFVGANLGMYYREHVGITFLADALHGKARAVVLYAIQIGILAFCLYIVVAGIQLVQMQKVMGGFTFALPIDVPKYMISAILPVSFLAGTLHVLRELLEMDPDKIPRGGVFGARPEHSKTIVSAS